MIEDVYIISDLHLGGEPSEAGRGFRLMSRPESLANFIGFLTDQSSALELVINGDFVDFLAERHADPPHWRPLLLDQDLAVSIFQRIASRRGTAQGSGDAIVFDALRRFIASGKKLTLMLGNHDVELSYPKVRLALQERIGGPVEFIYDNEALVRGDAVIEHGNRYDRYNQVDHDGLRRFRSVVSRGAALPARASFNPSPGSQLVSSVMNVIKQEFPFVDLLKPETGAVIPTLLALRPSLRESVLEVIRALLPSVTHGMTNDGSPRFAGNINASETSSSAVADATLVLGDRVARELTTGDEAALPFAGDIASSGGPPWVYSLMRLFTSNEAAPLEQRLPTLLKALRLLKSDRSFSEQEETEKEYEDAALSLSRAGFRYIVFGHTHLPKQIVLSTGSWYLNSGTWADRIRLPDAIFDADRAKALIALGIFVQNLRSDALSELAFQDYTYVRLRLSDSEGGRQCHDGSLEHWRG